MTSRSVKRVMEAAMEAVNDVMLQCGVLQPSTALEKRSMWFQTPFRSSKSLHANHTICEMRTATSDPQMEDTLYSFGHF